MTYDILLENVIETLKFYSNKENFTDHCNLGKVEFNEVGTWEFGHKAKECLLLIKENKK